MRRVIAAVLVPLTAIYVSGCSFFASPTQQIMIAPSHPKAEVYVDGMPKGKGAITVQLSRKTEHAVMAKCGQSSGMAMVDRSLSTTGMLDLVGGIFLLFPFLGLLAPGAWELSPPTVAVAIPDSSACD